MFNESFVATGLHMFGKKSSNSTRLKMF